MIQCRVLKFDLQKNITGVLVPVFALRTEEDLGVGDTAAVKQMIDWCARHGFRVLQLLPINETTPENSPYDVVSSVALDPTTIAFPPDACPSALRAELQRGGVHYSKVKALKQQTF